MFCENCGHEISEGSGFCENCGAKVGISLKKVEDTIDSVSNKVDEEVNKAIDSVNSSFNPNTNQYGNRFLKTDRSLLIYILLDLITCGIYKFFFIQSISNDVNEACKNDSERTPGFGMFLLMWLVSVILNLILSSRGIIKTTDFIYAMQSGSFAYISNYYSTIIGLMVIGFITNIYPLYWRFKLGNKLQRNGQEYGIMINENGSTVLIWDIIGILCCCIGSLYALYILIKNTNTICTAYNNKYVLKNN